MINSGLKKTSFKRIMIIGSPGSGKTTLSTELGDILDIDVFHLDSLFWKPGWKKTITSERHEILYPIVEKKHWIIDGTYKDSLDVRLKTADCVIFLKISRHICLWRVVKRRFLSISKPYSYIAPGCRDKIDCPYLLMLWDYPSIDEQLITSKLGEYCDELTIIELKTPLEVKCFLKFIKAS